MCKTGKRYEGRWMEDTPHIRGKMVYRNKDVYEGNWHCGKRHGIGKMQFANGDVYDGQFESDQLSGKGIYQYANGSSYDGEVMDGVVSLALPRGVCTECDDFGLFRDMEMGKWFIPMAALIKDSGNLIFGRGKGK